LTIGQFVEEKTVACGSEDGTDGGDEARKSSGTNGEVQTQIGGEDCLSVLLRSVISRLTSTVEETESTGNNHQKRALHLKVGVDHAKLVLDGPLGSCGDASAVAAADFLLR
jgi:hypothetical protein